MAVRRIGENPESAMQMLFVMMQYLDEQRSRDEEREERSLAREQQTAQLRIAERQAGLQERQVAATEFTQGIADIKALGLEKEEAQRMLKAHYKKHGRPWPGDEDEVDVGKPKKPPYKERPGGLVGEALRGAGRATRSGVESFVGTSISDYLSAPNVPEVLQKAGTIGVKAKKQMPSEYLIKQLLGQEIDIDLGL
jgi:hypothetical protein